jgi:DNA-binding CsgD family transcriptional regulator
MDLWDALPSPGEPPEVHHLRSCSREIVERLHKAAEDEDRTRLLVGLPALVAELRRVEPTATRTSWVIQPQYSYDPEDPGIPLTRKAAARGVDTELITRPRTVLQHPLLSSIFPRTRLGPCFLRAMVVDGEMALVGAPDTIEGERALWATTLPEAVDAVTVLWHDTLPLCEPILPPGTPPPLTDRQLEVARLLCIGEKDTVIARMLNLSSRTVERDVAAVCAALGAGSRTEAVLQMRGRGVNGGWLHPDEL